MVIKINMKTIIQYLLIYLFYMLHSSVLCNLNETLFTTSLFIIGTILIVFYKIKVPNRLYFSLGFLFLNIIFVRYISGGVGINAFIFWASMFVITYAAYFIEPDMFVERYVKLVLFFASISLIFWTISLVAPNLVRRLTIFHISNPDYNNSIFDGLLLYVTRDDVTRNVGVFGEPGLYQIVLNIALLFCLFMEKKLSWNKNKRTFAIIIFVFTIFSAQSTTGYIAAVAITGVYLISQRDKIKGRFVLLASLVIALLVWNFISAGNESFINKVVLSKLINTHGIVDINASTGYWRMIIINISISLLKNHPFGSGYDTMNMLISRQAVGAAGNGLFVAVTALGIEFIAVLIYSLLIPGYKNRKNMLMFVLTVFLYINTTLAQSNVFYPALVVLFIINFKESSEGKNDENPMVCERNFTSNSAQLK
jgi:hypothetical protein